MLDRFRGVIDDPKTGARLGATLLIAAALSFGAIFTPFVTQGCINCPLDTIPARSVFQGLDGWIVLFVVVALVLFSLASLRNRRQRGTEIACVALAASSLALCIFERVDAVGRVIGQDGVLPPVELGHPGVQLHGIPPSIYTDFGFYLFLVSSIVAIIAAVGVLVTMRGNPTSERTTAAMTVW
ncbi:MAG: hypothetical protein WAW53_12805 [Candidatus Dormiibacterota bacterium]